MRRSNERGRRWPIDLFTVRAVLSRRCWTVRTRPVRAAVRACPRHGRATGWFDFTHQPADNGALDPEEVLGIQGPPAEEVLPEPSDAVDSEPPAAERQSWGRSRSFRPRSSSPRWVRVRGASGCECRRDHGAQAASRPAHATEPAEAPAGDKTISGPGATKPSGIAVRVLTGLRSHGSVEMPGLSVGRDDANDLVVRSWAVSRRHVFLCPTERGLFLEDWSHESRARGRRAHGLGPGGALPIIDICGARLRWCAASPNGLRAVRLKKHVVL